MTIENILLIIVMVLNAASCVINIFTLHRLKKAEDLQNKIDSL